MRTRQVACCVCLMLAAFVAARPAGALGPERRGLRLSAGVGMLSGESTFDIGGKFVGADGSTAIIHFPLSRLEYPLDVVIGSVKGACDIGERWTISASVSKNLASDAGKAKDSDWGIFFGPNSLDIYSESDADLDALMFNAGIRYILAQGDRWSLSGALGYLHQQYDYEKSNLLQEYPSLRRYIAPDYVEGKVAEYEVVYSVPYVQAIGRLRLSQSVTMEAGLGYSPFARARDEGHWILREKTFSGRSDGDALFVSFKARLDLGEHWFMLASLENTTIDTTGTQDQHLEGRYLGRIDNKIKNDQSQAMVSVGRLF